MNVKEQFAERVEIFDDAVRMKKAPKRVNVIKLRNQKSFMFAKA